MSRRDDVIEQIRFLEPQLALEFNGGFINFLQYFKDSAKACDASWHNCNFADKDDFVNLKASKIAAMNVIGYLDSVKFELEQLKAELAQLDEQE